MVYLIAGLVFWPNCEGSALEEFLDARIELSGRLHPQYDYLESRLEGVRANYPTVSKRDYFRRVMAGVKVSFNDRLRGRYLTDVSDGVVKNQIARLEWRVNEHHAFHFGYQKVPFGLEDTTSSALVKPIERSANTRFWNEVIGIGSYHSGVFYQGEFKHGARSALGLTHNVKGDSKVPALFEGEVALYGRLSRKGDAAWGERYELGVDLGFQPSASRGDVAAVSFFGNTRVAGCDWALEATGGEIALPDGGLARAWGYHLQGARRFAKKIEGVARISQVDTGGFPLKLSSAIRKAPYSGYKYGKVDSLYLGANYYLKQNKVKLSCGYEIAEGREAQSGPGSLAGIKEDVSGLRLRGQLLF